MPFDGNLPLEHRIAAVVSREFGIPVCQIMGTSRIPATACARHVVWWVMRMKFGKSYAEVGRAFGRDHTSVINGMNRIEERIADADFQSKLQAVSKCFSAELPQVQQPKSVTELDRLALDLIVRQARKSLYAKMKSDPEAFRVKHAQAYRRIREVAA
jgi:hypothetical protein